MKRGLILINAYSSLKPVIYQGERLKTEFERLGVTADVRHNDFLGISTDGDGKIVNGFGGYDFCVYLDKDKYTSRLLEKYGMRLFNRHGAILACDDKMETHAALSGHGIPMPPTIPAPLCYDENAQIKESMLDKIESALGYPLIVKNCYGSRGTGVYLIKDRAELYSAAERLKCVPHLYQKCVNESLGRDVRVIVIGNKAVAAMQRRSKSDFRSNIALGGRGEKFDIPEDMRRLCEKTADILGLDYCGIDLLFGKDGFSVCEVNSNAFFDGIESVTGVNVAKLYAEHIYKSVYCL